MASDLNHRLARIIAERGIEPAAEPVMHPDGWILDNPAGWMMDQAEQRLRKAMPAQFAHARLRDCPPGVQTWGSLHLAEPRRHPWLRLHGAPGRGKTFCAWALIRTLAMAHASRGRSYDWRFVTNVDLNDQLRPKPDESHAYAIRRYLDADLLVLDDIGSGKPSDWVTEQILRIVNHRYDLALPSIYTSNEGPDELAYVLDARVTSRIIAADVVIVDGPDRRHREGQYLDG